MTDFAEPRHVVVELGREATEGTSLEPGYYKLEVSSREMQSRLGA